MGYQLKDSYYWRAKKEGYRSRAAYKLQELNQSYRLIGTGNRVLDLGAAPGGWLQVASKLVGPKGKVLGVDNQPIALFKEENILLLPGDISEEATQAKIRQQLGGAADCVLSDLSPRLSGIHDVDISRSLDLARTAFQVACSLIRPGGNFVVKTFIGEETTSLFKELQPYFESVHRTRAEATRKHSSEIYMIGKGFRKSANSRS